MDRFLSLKAFLIGGSMLIPGVSGGTMSMIFGVYERLIAAVNAHKKEDLLFLLRFTLGAGAAFLLLSAPMAALSQSYPREMGFFVIGVMVGGVPVIYQAAGKPDISRSCAAALIFGIALVFLLRLLPANLFQGGGASIKGILLQFATGILGALALVLPGISFSSMLYLMGVYEFLLNAMGTGQIFLLIPFLAGGIIGVLLLTRFLDRAMKEHPEHTYMVILGFAAASLWDIFAALPSLPTGKNLLFCLFLSAVGFLVTGLMARADSARAGHLPAAGSSQPPAEDLRSPACTRPHAPDTNTSREPSPEGNQRRFCRFPLPRRRH